MYNGHDYLSCIKIPATKQANTKGPQKVEQIEPMDFTASHQDLISIANKVFGEGKWNHTVTSQTLDYIENIGAKCHVGCVSFVKVQLDNGNFHEDIGYYNAEESTKGLSIYNARIGSTISALRRVLLSFGDEVKTELEQLQKQASPKQISTKQKNAVQLSDDNQIQERSNVLVKVSVSHIPQVEHKDHEINKNTVPSVSNVTAEVNTSVLTKDQNPKTIVQSTPDQKEVENNDTITKSERKLNQEAQRLERKRKQLEKQLEFKKRMMEKEGLVSSSNNKPNPKY